MSIHREKFPIFETKTYINSCSQGALSGEVRQAYADYLTDWEEKGSPWDLWVEKLEAVRASFAKLIHAQPDHVAVTTSVSASISAIASGLDFSGDRDTIVITDFAFPTSAQIWYAQELRGARVVRVPERDGWIETDAIAAAIDERTKIVSIPAVCYRNGARLDAAGIVEAAHAKGALVLLDAYQALGTYPIYVDELDVDFLVGGALKYLLASAGLAYAWARPELIAEVNPTITGWFAQADIFAMSVESHAPSPTARRFEAGTPAIPALYAGLAGMEILHSIGIKAIQAQIWSITGSMKEAIQAAGFVLASPLDPNRHGAMISVRSSDVEQLVTRLGQDGIIVSSRDGNLRISPHFYNNEADVARLMDGLVAHRDLLIPAKALS